MNELLEVVDSLSRAVRFWAETASNFSKQINTLQKQIEELQNAKVSAEENETIKRAIEEADEKVSHCGVAGCRLCE